MTKKIAVIDGNSLMHRAYHAIQNPMNAPDGTPTNAVFGFLQMFCKFIEAAAPDAVVCAFDAGKPKFRIEDLPQYKAHRPHMDDELRVQFPIIEELLESMNVPVVKVPGWEGDDILGTVAARDEKCGFETLLVTGDKDACQLATDLTKIVTTKKGISDVDIMGPERVAEKFGVTPEQFTDFLGLMGDASDNIPGVPGVGPKTAVKLLQEYGNIEGVYEHIDDLKGKMRERLEENEQMAYLSRQIATIACDLDFPLDVEGLSFPEYDVSKVKEAFKKYALVSPLSRVLKLGGGVAAAGDAPGTADEAELAIDVGEILEGAAAEDALSQAMANGELIGIAVEEEGEATLFGSEFSFAFFLGENTAFFEGDAGKEALANVVAQGKSATLDSKALLRHVYPPNSAEVPAITYEQLKKADVFDIGLAAYVLDSTNNSYSYEMLAEKYLGASVQVPENAKDTRQAICSHAYLCRALAPRLQDALKEDSSSNVYSDIDQPLVHVLMSMERTGAALDSVTLSKLGEYASDELEKLSQQIFEISGEQFNIDSPKQLGHVLFEVMGLPPVKKNKNGYSTDASVLKELAKTHEIANLVIRYRELSKIKGTYIDSLPKMVGADGRIHTNFHETVTATGRISSSDPNLQNIPVRTDFGRRIRECFVPLKEGEKFLSADYSQIELRLLAHLSEDQNLIDAFESGADFHARTAARVFDLNVEDVTPQLRSRAKAVNFGIVYGQQAFGLSQSLDIPMAEAREMIDRYFAAYPKVKQYLNDTVKSATELGYAETMFGRKRHIPELRSPNKRLHGVGERTAMNHPMQGSAADIIKLAMIEVDNRLKSQNMKSELLLQVHDELDFSVPTDELDALSAMVKEVMENVVQLRVPLLVDVSFGDNWAQAH